MKIVYTAHLEFRLKIRDISYDLPRKIFEQAQEHYYDKITRHYIAIHRIEFKGRLREMVLTYDEKEKLVEIITVHPIELEQKLNRINTGRWVKT